MLASTPSLGVQLSVYLMISGALVAALNDLAFTTEGYVYVLLNDFFTAGNGILIKQKLETKEVGKYGLMLYNCLLMLPFTAILFLITDDVIGIIGRNERQQIKSRL